VQYADASGDGAKPGWGFWFVIQNVLFYAHGSWTSEQSRIPFHALELWASTVGLFTAYALRAFKQYRPFALEYTDDSPSEFVADSNQAKCPLLQFLIVARSDFFDASGVCSLPKRVSSAANVWADQLSRNQVDRVIVSGLSRSARLDPTPS